MKSGTAPAGRKPLTSVAMENRQAYEKRFQREMQCLKAHFWQMRLTFKNIKWHSTCSFNNPLENLLCTPVGLCLARDWKLIGEHSVLSGKVVIYWSKHFKRKRYFKYQLWNYRKPWGKIKSTLKGKNNDILICWSPTMYQALNLSHAGGRAGNEYHINPLSVAHCPMHVVTHKGQREDRKCNLNFTNVS